MDGKTLSRAVLILLLVVFSPAATSVSQTVNPSLLHSRWQADWITSPQGPPREFGVYHFRKAFDLAAIPEHFLVHVTADNRYELFVNGARVLEGPARGDLDHWRYETVDISRQLHSGKNALAVVVWNFAELAPMAQMTNETGFILQGDSQAEAVVNTNSTWKCLRDSAVQMIRRDPKKVHGYFVVGPGERVDGSRYPWGWQSIDYNDSGWKPATPISEGGPRGIQDSPSRWMLVPRSIPLMEERLERLARVVRSSTTPESAKPAAGNEFLACHAPITVPPNSRVSILFDQSHLTTAYPELVTSGGQGAEVTLTYAEALWKKDGTKGNRNVTEGKQMRGFQDVILPDGGAHRLFRPLWWRTYRYLQIDAVTGAEPLVIEDLRGMFSAYPFKMEAGFESSDPTLHQIWTVSWRTARLCAHETYMDCPYYEQLQYAGDTRIQALISLYMTGDDRLVKNAIESLDESRTPEGLTQSRYPSFLPQYIPPFSLLWIGMMHDLWWYRGENPFLAQYLPNLRAVLSWFEQRLTGSGLLGRLEWWDFVDWAKDFQDGVPPQEVDGQSSILSLQFAAALRDAADLEASFGRVERARHDRELSAKITEAVRRTCWDSSRGLIADTPARKHFSQHANVLAILTDTVPPPDQRKVMETVLRDSTLTQCTYYFRFYLFRAMKKAGLGDDYLSQLGPWRHMLELGLTTWAETPEPTRSDCHAWSAHPNFDLLATVAGIESAAPGFSRVVIAPHLGPLRQLSATLPHPQGKIAVRYERQGTSLVADITLPGNLSGWFYWDGKKKPLHGGRQHLVF